MANELEVILTGDSSKLTASLNTASKKLSSFGKRMSNVGSQLQTRLALPLLAIGGASIKLASDFEESMNKVDVAFQDSSDEVKKFAKTSLRAFGIAEGSALDMAALFGDMSTSMGVSTKDASKLSTELVGLAGDLASFKNMNISEVTTALNGVFTGETESLKRLGIVMTQVNLEQFAMEQGITKNIKAMTQAEKVQLRFRYVLEKTKNAQGDFTRTSGGAANQTRIFQESLKELGVSFGQLVLPLFTKLVSKANELINKFKGLSFNTKALVIGLTGIGIALPSLITLFGGLITVLGALISPIGLIAAGLTGIAYIITKNWNEILPVIVGVYNQFVDLYNSSSLLRGVIQGIGAVLKTAFETALLPLKVFISHFKTLWKLIKEFAKNGVGGEFKDILKNGFDEAAEITEKSGESIGKAWSDAFNNTIEDRLENKTPEQIQASLTKLGNKIKKPVQEFWDKFKGSLGGGVSSSSNIDTGNKEQEEPDYGGVTEEEYKEGLKRIEEATIQHNLRIGESNTELKDNTMSGLEEVMEGYNMLSMGIQDAFLGAFESVLDGSGDFFGSLIKGLVGLIKKLIAAALAAAVLSTLLGGLKIGKVAGTVTSFKGLFAGFTGIGSQKAFANGGIVSSPTNALIGEYPGARSNPEVVAPLDKLQGIIGNTGGYKDVNVTGEFRIQGQDLVVALDRAQKTQNRLT